MDKPKEVKHEVDLGDIDQAIVGQFENFSKFQHETIFARRKKKIKSIDAYNAKKKHDSKIKYDPGHQKIAEDDIVKSIYDVDPDKVPINILEFIQNPPPSTRFGPQGSEP